MPGIVLATVGSGTPPAEVTVPHVRFGHIGYPRVLSLAYSAADVVVIPSLQDNFPNVALEALACGVPVVGFAVGGIPDVVRPGLTGLLAAPANVPALGAAIRELLTDPERRAAIGARCRTIAVEEYALARQPQRYLELYRSILESQASTGRVTAVTPA